MSRTKAAAIAAELSALGIIATGACDLTLGQWQRVEQLAGTGIMGKGERLMICEALAAHEIRISRSG